jgi:serine beta-lactamase-like protein LACTB
MRSLWIALKMDNTELDTSFAGLKNEATYYAVYNGENKHIESIKQRDSSFLFGGGGFISTPSDLKRMAKATYGAKYLSDKARALLSTPVKMRNGKVNSDKYSLG